MVNITSMILGPLCSKMVTIQRDWSFLGTNKKINCVTYSHNSEYFIKVYKCTFVFSSSVCNEKGQSRTNVHAPVSVCSHKSNYLELFVLPHLVHNS